MTFDGDVDAASFSPGNFQIIDGPTYQSLSQVAFSSNVVDFSLDPGMLPPPGEVGQDWLLVTTSPWAVSPQFGVVDA